MGQQLSNVNAYLVNWTNKDLTTLNSNSSVTNNENENVNLFLPMKTLTETATNTIISSEKLLLKQIQSYLFSLIESDRFIKINKELSEILMKNGLRPILDHYEKELQEIKKIVIKQNQMQKFFKKNFDAKNTSSTVADASIHTTDSSTAEEQQFSCFAINLLVSLLLVSIKAQERVDNSITSLVITSCGDLCEQIPIRNISSSELFSHTNKLFFNSLKPIMDHMHEVSMSTNDLLARQATQILLNFSIAYGSLTDLLPIISMLLCNTTNIYNMRNLFVKLNNNLAKLINQLEQDKTTAQSPTDQPSLISLNYLKTNEVFPNTKLAALDEKRFTGEFILSAILAYIDINNEIDLNKQYDNGTMYSSISFEFHPNTFQQLFHIIEQLSTYMEQNPKPIHCHILIFCIKLFKAHLKFLCTLKSNMEREFLKRIDDEILQDDHELSNVSIDNNEWNKFANPNELEKWFDLFLKLACSDNQDHHQQLESAIICREASKTLIYVLSLKVIPFAEKLSFIQQYIIDNKHTILVEELSIELNKTITICQWIEMFSDDKILEKTEVCNKLYSFVDAYFNSMSHSNEEQKQRIQKILSSFEQLYLVCLVPRSIMKTMQQDIANNIISDDLQTFIDPRFSSFFVQHISIMLKNYLNKMNRSDKLMDEILFGLCLMTQTEVFNFATIQPMFTFVLPLLADYILLQDTNNDVYVYTMYWLIGKMTHILINGSPQSLLEMKYIEKLKSPLFNGGCEVASINNDKYLLTLYESNLAIYSKFSSPNENQQSSLDYEFLMAIYNNIDQGEQLISKMKMHVKNRPCLLQSIENQANEACTALFAVYIKHYRRIHIAKLELSHSDDRRPHHKLLSLYEYASRIGKLFVETKAQGGDCNQLYQKIKMKTLFLLSIVKESHFIPMIHDDISQLASNRKKTILDIEQKTNHSLQSSCSRWTKSKHIFRILRHTLHACIRFKRLMLAKRKAIEQNQDNESILNKEIHSFVCSDFEKSTAFIISEDTKLECEQLTKCMIKQHERAIIRLIAYRFMHTYFEKTLAIRDKQRISMILSICSPYMRKSETNWFYLENIEPTNNNLQEEIRTSYYSIIKVILSFVLLCEAGEENLFHLLNISYTMNDICLVHRYQFVETVFKTYVSFCTKQNRPRRIDVKYTGFNWFRLYIFSVCKNVHIEEWSRTTKVELIQEQEFLFKTLILNELKGLRQLQQELSGDTQHDIIDNVDRRNYSLHNASISWFIHDIIHNKSVECTETLLTKFEIELCTNQWLAILLRCVHLYEHVRSVCGTIEFIEELVYIYRNSQNSTTSLLALKILRDILPLVPKTADESSSSMINKLLNEFLFSIGEMYNSRAIATETITELIYLYRTIMSYKSPWQTMATEFVLDSIIKLKLNTIDWKSLEITNKKQWNYLLASLFVLGGYIPPYDIGSIVEVYTGDENDEYELGVIIDIDTNALDIVTVNAKPYFIQYFQGTKTEWVTTNRLQIKVDVCASKLFFLANCYDSNVKIHEILDTLGFIIQLDTSSNDCLSLLQLQRYSITTLYYLINENRMIDIFMNKSYAPFIAKLAMIDSFDENHSKLTDLNYFNRSHLEQYCFSLDRFERLKTIVNTNETNVTTTEIRIDSSSNICSTTKRFSQWKPYASKHEIEFYKKGRQGSDDISIVPFPEDIADLNVIEDCGNIHRFKGRINLSSSYRHGQFPTFLVGNLELTEGNWYYCVRLRTGGLVQIGWATHGFTPDSDGGNGIGDDAYSWSFDGSRGTLYHNREFQYLTRDTHWSANDVCGCGIEIDGENTNIKYWLNGKFLGTAFTHKVNIASTDIPCDLLPNGSNTKYFPGITIQSNVFPSGCCEFIFSPEDMAECPLPKGYKSILLPPLIQNKTCLAAYPYSAYLVGDDMKEFIYKPRDDMSIKILRDFINEQHIETNSTISNCQLRLNENNNEDFPLSIDSTTSSLTISFNFQILTNYDNNTDDNKLDLVLFILETTEKHSIQIPLKKTNEELQTIIVIDSTARQMKIYVNSQCRTVIDEFNTLGITKFNFHFLPHISAGIKNVAIWKYALSDDHIQRLFTDGISYVALDYEQLKEYRLQANTFTFKKNQKDFLDEFLIVMDESLDEELDKQKQTQASRDESNSSKTIDETNESIVNLYGNESYLIVKKTSNKWHTYTLVLDISIPDLPERQEELTLIVLNSETRIFVTSENKLCLSTLHGNSHTESTIQLNQFIRLVINVHNKVIKLYVDGWSVLEKEVDDNSLLLSANQFHLFQENNLRKNIIHKDTVRIQCKSITYLNQSIADSELDETLKSSKYSLEKFVAPPYALISRSLLGIGYESEWIKSIMKQYNTNHIQQIDTLIREHKEDLLKKGIENEKQHMVNIFSELGSLIDRKKLKHFIDTSSINNNNQMVTITEHVLSNWNDLQRSPSVVLPNEIINESMSNENDKRWFRIAMNRFGLNQSFNEWIQDKSTKSNTIDRNYQLFDLSKSDEERSIAATGLCDQQTKTKTSIQYSHIDISDRQYLDSRIACEHGLMLIYARETILNILKVKLTSSSYIFPLEKLGDYPFIIKLLSAIDYHYTYKNNRLNDSINTVSCLVKSILKHEIKQLIQSNYEILSNEVPLFSHLQKNIIIQSIQFLLKCFSSAANSDGEIKVIYENIENERSNLNFSLKILKLFVELISDPSIMKQDQIDRLISIFFPEQLINVMFDLFLLFPKHQSKVYILQLFVSLMQASKFFNINERIQQFIKQLLITLLSDDIPVNDQTILTLRHSAMDFVFLNFKQLKDKLIKTNDIHGCHEIDLSDFPQNFQDLWMVLDTIDALTDETKRTSFPDALLIQSYSILDDEHLFSLNDITVSNAYFDKISDLQLISLMNNDALIEHSFSEFLDSLPIVYMSKVMCLELYPALSTIPSEVIQNRAKVFYVLEIFFEKILPLLDLNSSNYKTIITDKIRLVKNYISNRTRIQWLEQVLAETKTNQLRTIPSIHFDLLKANAVDDGGQNSIFSQGYEQLHAQAHLLFRNDNERLWQAEYIGMHSTDQGGPYRDSITTMCSDICCTRLPLFILCPNARSKTGLNRDRWIPNVFPLDQSIPIQIKQYYRFIGQLMGMAIRKKHYLDLKFPNLLWKQLVDEQITMNDIETIDTQCFARIKEMQNYMQQNQVIDVQNDTNYLFSNIMSELRFDIVSSAGHTFELVPGGKDISITADNFKEYYMRYCDYRLNEFRRQIEYIRQGLCSIIPNSFLSLITSSELEENVCGKGHIDIELLKRNSRFSYTGPEAQYIQRFWKVLSEMFNEEQKKSFLKFVWGRNTLPCRDEDFKEHFSINLIIRDEIEADRMLPLTCVRLQAQTTPEQNLPNPWHDRGFCDPDQYQTALQRCQTGYESCDLFIKAFEERASIERDYVAAIREWSNSWYKEIADSKEFGTNKKTWLATIHANEQVASIHKGIFERIQHDVIDQMVAFKRDHYSKSIIHVKKIKEFEKEFEYLQKPWIKRLSKIKDAKESYQDKRRKLTRAEQAKKIIESNTGASEEDKIEAQTSVEVYTRELASLRSKYEQLIDEMKQAQPNYENGMKSILDRTHAFERERLNKFKELFNSFYNAINIQNDRHLIEMCTHFQNALALHDVEADIQWWNKHYGSDTKTSWPQFEELS